MTDLLDGRCATCKHWEGDKEKALAMFEENPMSMDLHKGWPNDGECDEWHLSLNLDISGDAIVIIRVDANFGCIHYRRQNIDT